jgi:hypothetical protein
MAARSVIKALAGGKAIAGESDDSTTKALKFRLERPI